MIEFVKGYVKWHVQCIGLIIIILFVKLWHQPTVYKHRKTNQNTNDEITYKQIQLGYFMHISLMSLVVINYIQCMWHKRPRTITWTVTRW